MSRSSYRYHRENMWLILKAVLLVTVTVVSGCEDIEEATCAHIIQLYGEDFCKDSCLSKLCKRSCGLCPMKCYECHEIDNPKNCTTITECPSPDHNCFTTQSFADDFREIYKLGCATKDLCKSYFGSSRKRSLRVEATCCSYDNCNDLTPEEIAFEKTKHRPVTHTVKGNTTMQPLINDCQDLHDADCQRIASIKPNFCIDQPCAAEKLCPRMCKKCFRCSTCIDIDRVEDCHTTAACNGGKQCFTLETLSYDLRPVFRLGCMDKSICSRFKISPSNGFGKRQQLQLKGGCCGYDLCNDNRIITTTSTAATTTTIRTTTRSCGYTTKDSCPRDSYQYHNACYFVGTQAMSWNASQAYCASMCGKLAEFSSSSYMERAVSHLRDKGLHSNTQHNLLSLNLWSDGIQTHVYGSHRFTTHWIWSHSGSRIDTSLDNNLPSSHFSLSTHVPECAYIGDRRGHPDLYPMECSKALFPLCAIDTH